MKKFILFLLLLCISFAIISCSDKIVTPDVVNNDKVAPAAVTDLNISFITGNSATLLLTPTGDDGDLGRARTYDVRYAITMIDSANFSSATSFTPLNEPNVGGNLDTIVVPSLLPNTKYYFAVKLADENSNWSPISNIDSATTLLSGTWTVYNKSNSGILSNIITDIQFDVNIKYIATEGGLSSFDNTNWNMIYESRTISSIDTIVVINDTTYDTTYFDLPDFANSVAVESSDKIWFGTNSSGVALFEGDSTIYYSSNDSGSLTSTRDLAITNSHLWVGTLSNGLHSFTLDGSDLWEQYDVPTSSQIPINGKLNCLEATLNNEIWIGLNLFGTTVLDNGIFTTYGGLENFTIELVSDITSSATQIIFGTDDGLFILENNFWFNYKTTNGLPDNVVTAVAVDSQGLIWCGTEFGLVSFDGTNWQIYTISNSVLPSDNIKSLNIDIFGNLWIGTDNGLARLTY